VGGLLVGVAGAWWFWLAGGPGESSWSVSCGFQRASCGRLSWLTENRNLNRGFRERMFVNGALESVGSLAARGVACRGVCMLSHFGGEGRVAHSCLFLR